MTTITQEAITRSFLALGITGYVSSEKEIRDAFRRRVKQVADGRGGYLADMAALTDAKEVLLAALNETKKQARRKLEYSQMMLTVAEACDRLHAFLEPSGLFSSVRTIPTTSAVVLSLDLKDPLVFSARVVRFLLNFLGESRPNCDEREQTLAFWCSSYVEEVSLRSCQIWIDCAHLIGWGGLTAIGELIMMAVKFSQPSVLATKSFYSYDLDDLLRVHHSRDELLAEYERFVSGVLANHDDQATPLCDPALRDMWLCCPKHRYLFARRLMLSARLCELHDPLQSSKEFKTEYTEYSETYFFLEAPTHEEMKQYVSSLLAQSLTPRSWFEEYFAHYDHLDREHWERATRHCSRLDHISFQCCTFHQSLNVIGRFFETWLVCFDSLYHMSYVSTQDYLFGLRSLYGLALFAHKAHVDLRTMTIPPRYEHMLDVYVSDDHWSEME